MPRLDRRRRSPPLRPPRHRRPAPGRDAHDLVGVDPDGDAIALRVVGAPHLTVLAFLSSSCLTCGRFWDDLRTAIERGAARGRPPRRRHEGAGVREPVEDRRASHPAPSPPSWPPTPGTTTRSPDRPTSWPSTARAAGSSARAQGRRGRRSPACSPRPPATSSGPTGAAAAAGPASTAPTPSGRPTSTPPCSPPASHRATRACASASTRRARARHRSRRSGRRDRRSRGRVRARHRARPPRRHPLALVTLRGVDAHQHQPARGAGTRQPIRRHRRRPHRGLRPGRRGHRRRRRHARVGASRPARRRAPPAASPSRWSPPPPSSPSPLDGWRGADDPPPGRRAVDRGLPRLGLRRRVRRAARRRRRDDRPVGAHLRRRRRRRRRPARRRPAPSSEPPSASPAASASSSGGGCAPPRSWPGCIVGSSAAGPACRPAHDRWRHRRRRAARRRRRERWGEDRGSRHQRQAARRVGGRHPTAGPACSARRPTPSRPPTVTGLADERRGVAADRAPGDGRPAQGSGRLRQRRRRAARARRRLRGTPRVRAASASGRRCSQRRASRGAPTAAWFNRRALQRTLDGQTGFQRFFSHGGRAFCLYVVLGRDSGIDPVIGRVRTALRGDRGDAAMTATLRRAPSSWTARLVDRLAARHTDGADPSRVPRPCCGDRHGHRRQSAAPAAPAGHGLRLGLRPRRPVLRRLDRHVLHDQRRRQHVPARFVRRRLVEGRLVELLRRRGALHRRLQPARRGTRARAAAGATTTPTPATTGACAATSSGTASATSRSAA